MAELVRAWPADAVQNVSLLRAMALHQALRARIKGGMVPGNTEATPELDRGRRDDMGRLRKRNKLRLLRQLQRALRVGAV